MKRISIYLILSLSILPVTLIGQEKSAADLMYEAIYHEEVTGDLDKAVTLLNEVLKNCTDKRIECAQALYHLGLVAEMKAEGRGKKAKGKEEVGKVKSLKGAEAYYVQIIEKYPEVGDYAELARGRLAKLKDANTFVDPRDGHKYRWVKIGNQVWMAENLAYMPWVNPPKKQEFGIWVYDYDGHDVAEAKTTENYQKYGCLYDWTTAMDIDPKYLTGEWIGDLENHQGICPPGWRVPSDGDWTELEVLLGMTEKDLAERADPWNLGTWQVCGANKLKSTRGWLSDGNGTNDLQFGIVPGGARFIEKNERKILQDIGANGNYWSTSEYTDTLCSLCFTKGWVSFRRMFANIQSGKSDDVVYRSPEFKSSGFSIRCIKSDNPLLSNKKESYLELAQQHTTQANALEPDYIEIQPELVHVIPKDQTIKRIRLIYYGDTIYHPNYTHTQIVNKKLIYYTNSDSTITAYDLENYRPAWTVNYYVSGGFAVNGDTLIFSDSKNVIALNGRNGEKIRSFEFPEINTIRIIDNQKIFGKSRSATNQTVYCMDYYTGKEVWKFNLEDSTTFSEPAIDHNLIYLLTASNKIQTLKGQQPERPDLVALDINSGKVQWSFDECVLAAADYSPEIVDNDIIFMDTYGRYVYSIDKLTGKLKWRYYMDVRGFGAFLQDDKGLFFADSRYNGEPCLAYFIDYQGKEIWKKKLTESWAPLMLPEVNLDGMVGIRQRNSILFINKSSDGKDWIMPMPEQPLTGILSYQNRLIIPTKSGIYFYKVPEFK